MFFQRAELNPDFKFPGLGKSAVDFQIRCKGTGFGAEGNLGFLAIDVEFLAFKVDFFETNGG